METGRGRRSRAYPVRLKWMLRRLRRTVRRQPKQERIAASLLILMLLSLSVPRRHALVRPVRPVRLRISSLVVDPPGIVLHCSDSPAKYHGVTVNAARLEDIHAHDHPDWATTCSDGKVYHIGYHYVILPDGVIENGRPDTCLGTHARTYNDWIGICVIGAFQTNRHWWPRKPTPAQIKSIIALCERLMSKYHIPPELVKRHRDINNTYCPGDRFPYFKILAILKSYAAAHPETRSMPGRVVSLPIPGRHTRRVYPAILGTPVMVR